VLKNRMQVEIEEAVVAPAVEQPAWGQVRVSEALKPRGLSISSAGVRCVWQRPDLTSMRHRLKALEAKVAQDGILLTEAQIGALEKAKADKEALGERVEARKAYCVYSLLRRRPGSGCCIQPRGTAVRRRSPIILPPYSTPAACPIPKRRGRRSCRRPHSCRDGACARPGWLRCAAGPADWRDRMTDVDAAKLPVMLNTLRLSTIGRLWQQFDGRRCGFGRQLVASDLGAAGKGRATAADELVQAMGLSGISKSQVSKLCKDIDERVNAFLDRPFDGEWPYLWLDATYLKVRDGGRIVSVAAIIAVAVSTDGWRRIIGLGIGPSEAEPFWSGFLKGLVKRGLKGVKLVISDAHDGLRHAVTRVLGAAWQRCRVHWMRNALAHVP
jgi:hypothetical protein